MKFADYKCHDCDEIRSITVMDTDYFPPVIPCLKCGGECTRKYTPLHGICHQGKAGNSKNGYKSSPVSIKKT